MEEDSTDDDMLLELGMAPAALEDASHVVEDSSEDDMLWRVLAEEGEPIPCYDLSGFVGYELPLVAVDAPDDAPEVAVPPDLALVAQLPPRKRMPFMLGPKKRPAEQHAMLARAMVDGKRLKREQGSAKLQLGLNGDVEVLVKTPSEVKLFVSS